MKIEKQSIYHEKKELNKILKNDEIIRKSIFQRNVVLVSVILLTLFSAANMMSTSYYSAMSSAKVNPITHVIWIAIGFLAFWIVQHINYRWYRTKTLMRFTWGISVFILTIMVFAAKNNWELLGLKVIERNGALSWISIGSRTVQPAEFFKISYLIVASNYLTVAEKKGMKTEGILAGIIFILTTFTVPIIFQRDLGTILHYIFITCFLIMISPVSKKLISFVVTMAFIAYGYIVRKFYFLDVSEIKGNYKLERIKSYVEILYKGNLGDMDKGYQVIQSLTAMGNGGIIGSGYGNGIQKYNYLPEIHTDFISSSLAEEWGFLVFIIIIILFLQILKVSLNIAVLSKDIFARYLVVGLGSLIFTQMIMNLYVATGLLPVTGLPLPLLSYGGSSMVTIFIVLGIFFNINKETIRAKSIK